MGETAGKISDETLQAIRDRVSIVEIVSGYVSLKKAGRNFIGLCPFHAEKTPSFTVNDDRGLFHCFGCGVGGTVFTFVMRAERIEFRDAVDVLARRAGVALPKRSDGGPGGEQREQLIALNDMAHGLFRTAFRSPVGQPAREYLERRGFSAAIVERYGLGFCPPGGAGLSRALASKRSALQHALELGLLGRRNDGRTYDRLWGRVTFPIRDGRGRIIGFGGRTLGTDHPKYLNSPESMLFHKGEVLYGLSEAREAVRDTQRVVLVEGYLDALALVDAGVGYTVASLGTALTVAQLRLARRFAPEIVVFFDGDRAGQEAAARSFGVCVEAGVWGLGAFLPQGFDPDTFVRTEGADATIRLLGGAIPLADFFIQRMDPGPAAPLPARARAADAIATVLTRIRDPFQYNLVARQAAQRLGVDEAVFRRDRSKGNVLQPTSERTLDDRASEAYRPEEATLLQTMALERAVAEVVEERSVLESFTSTQLAAAGQTLIGIWKRGGNGSEIVDHLPPPLAQRLSAALLGEGDVAEGDRMQVAHDCIDRILERTRRVHVREALVRIREAEASGDDDQLREELQKNDLVIRRQEANRD